MSTTRNRHLTTFCSSWERSSSAWSWRGGCELTVPGMADPQVSLSATQVAAAKPAVRALPSFADLARRSIPAVVSIQAATIEKGHRRDRRGGLDPFEFFFGPRRRGTGDQQQHGAGQSARSSAPTPAAAAS